MVESADRGMTAFSRVTEFGNFAVDALPSRKHRLASVYSNTIETY